MKPLTAASAFVCVILLATSVTAQQAPPATQPAAGQVVAAPPTHASPAPKLKLSTTEWNFGSKWSGEEAFTEVTIENVGDDTLRIVNVRSSCGCTVARPAKRVLKPGESDKMTIKYDTKKHKKIVSQTITIETNDPVQPRVPIRIKGEVRPLFEAKPASRLTFGRLERTAAATQSIELSNNMESPVSLKIKSISNPAPFDIKLDEVTPGKQYKLVATTKPPLKIGANVTDVVLETGLDKFPSITYSVSAYVAPRVAVTPKRLYVSPRVTKEFKRIIRVSYRPDKPLKITSIKSSHPDLIKAELMPEPQSRGGSTITKYHMIKVTLPAGKDMPEGGASLEIYTDDPSPEYQKFVVEIRLRKAPRRVLKPTLRGAAKSPATPDGKSPQSKPKDKDGQGSPD